MPVWASKKRPPEVFAMASVTILATFRQRSDAQDSKLRSNAGVRDLMADPLISLLRTSQGT